jgi:hypothetical protein
MFGNRTATMIVALPGSHPGNKILTLVFSASSAPLR